ncbi:MAG: glycosyltransferase family 4 protein [Thermoplasmata archaeon]
MAHSNPALRILLVGGRILPYRHAGDKNYWLDVIRELTTRGHHVTVLSVTLETVPEPTEYACEYIRPVPVHLRAMDQTAEEYRFNEEYGWLRGTNNYASKTLSLWRIARSIRRHLHDARPDVVHFCSNFGPAMALLRPFAGEVPLSISAPTYNGGPVLYDTALWASFLGFDTVVPYSDAFARRLRALGVAEERLRTIRWGVDMDRFRPPTPEARESARRELGLQENEKVVFWAGFLQQMTSADFRFAVRAAELVLRAGFTGWRFFFCMKPEHYDPRFRRFERPGLTVGGTAQLFHRVQLAADVMLSPIADLRSTAAPPLTWIESMALGIPIITTGLPGADEVVRDGLNGFLIRSPEEAAQLFGELVRSPERLIRARPEARRRVEERFALSTSVTEYVDLWTAMAGLGPNPSPVGAGNGSTAQAAPPPPLRPLRSLM